LKEEIDMPLTPLDFWRQGWVAWFALCQAQFALCEQVMSASMPFTAGDRPVAPRSGEIPPAKAPAARTARRARPAA
jgi:hypothetical protein